MTRLIVANLRQLSYNIHRFQSDVAPKAFPPANQPQRTPIYSRCNWAMTHTSFVQLSTRIGSRDPQKTCRKKSLLKKRWLRVLTSVDTQYLKFKTGTKQVVNYVFSTGNRAHSFLVLCPPVQQLNIGGFLPC